MASSVWGDTVNTASRMESTSEPDIILVSQQVYDRINVRYELEAADDAYRFSPIGKVDLKGKGSGRGLRS